MGQTAREGGLTSSGSRNWIACRGQILDVRDPKWTEPGEYGVKHIHRGSGIIEGPVGRGDGGSAHASKGSQFVVRGFVLSKGTFGELESIGHT